MHKATIWLTFLLNACASTAAYREPEVQIPTAFRERLDSLAPRAQPSPNAVPVVTTDTAVVGEYWRTLGDTTLVRLLEEALGLGEPVERGGGASLDRFDGGQHGADPVAAGAGHAVQARERGGQGLVDLARARVERGEQAFRAADEAVGGVARAR